MIKFNRTTEYGLMALRHISRKNSTDPAEVTSAREIADSYGLPFEITAKTLQRLKEKGLIQSAHGAKGGYTLQRSLKEVSLAEFLELMEGPQSVVACSGLGSHNVTHLQTNVQVQSQIQVQEGRECEYGSRCEIRHVMNDLNSRVFQFLSGIQLAEIAESPVVPNHFSDPLSGAVKR